MPLSERELCLQANLSTKEELMAGFGTKCLQTLLVEYLIDFLIINPGIQEPSLTSITQCLFASHQHPHLPWSWAKADPGTKDGWGQNMHAARFAYRYLAHFPPLEANEWTNVACPPRRVVAAAEFLRYLHCLYQRSRLYPNLADEIAVNVWTRMTMHLRAVQKDQRVCETVVNHWNEPDSDCDLFTTLFVWPYAPV